MSSNTMPSLSDENRKQIGCMNGIFHLFDRHHFLAGRRLSRHGHKRLLQGSQHHMDPKYSTKTPTAKDLEKQQEKPRNSTESYRSSNASSSCSSQPETLKIIAIKEQKPSFPKGPKSSELQEVEDSIYENTRKISVESRVHVMKHIDSPRPIYAKPKATGFEGSTRVLANLEEITKTPPEDERLALNRFSYDERESGKSTTNLKELPRLSLDSRASSRRLDFLGRGLQMDKIKSSQVLGSNRETGGYTRSSSSSSLMVRLMGLDDFTDTNSTPNLELLPRTLKKTGQKTNQNREFSTSRGFKNDSSSPRLAINPSQDSPKPASPSKKSPRKSGEYLSSSSVYGEIEKRITEIEFKKTKQKTKGYGLSPPQILDSLIMINKPAKAMEKVKLLSSTRKEIKNPQKLQNRDPKHHKGISVTPRNNNLKGSCEKICSIDKKSIEQNCRGSPRLKVENCKSPRFLKNSNKVEREQSEPTTPSLNSGRAKQVVEKGVRNRKLKPKPMCMELSEDQSSGTSGETRRSSSSHMEIEVMSTANSIKANTGKHEKLVKMSREHVPTVEPVRTMPEQPSPISVLDATFYEEDSPSPVKKISTPFRESAESQSPDDQKNLTELPSDPHYEQNRKKIENINHLVDELRLLNNQPDETTVNPDHIYINKILLTPGLLKDANCISTTDRIDPNMFHFLESQEDGAKKSDSLESKTQKIQRKIVFDTVNEIFSRKIAERLFTSPEVLTKEVYLEVERLKSKQDCNLDSEDDGIIKIITADMKYRSEDWVDYRGEVPVMVLDIERLIFKDLINEVLL